MAVRSVVIELPVADGVCSCTAGSNWWRLSQLYDVDRLQHVRLARCLGCGRVWMKRLNAEQDQSEESWRGAETREVTYG